MNRAKQFAFLSGFEPFLNEIKAKALKWQTVHYSGTQNNQTATISYYTSLNPNVCGNIILIPGLATNTNLDPLMKTLMFWGLNHRRNIITINTFLGDFKDKPAVDDDTKNTYPEFVSLIEQSIKFIQPYTISNKNMLIGHSAGASGLTDAMNNLTENNITTNIGSVILFAPCFGAHHLDSINKQIERRMESNKNEITKNLLPMINAFDVWATSKIRHVYVSSNFISDMFNSKFRPDLMNKWNTTVTLVAAKQDEKVSFKFLEQCYKQLQQQSRSDLFNFVALQNTPHCILKPKNNNQDVIHVIKNQKTI